MTCICGHEHGFSASPACSNFNCPCPEYREAIGDNSIPPDYQKYIDSLDTTKDKIKWLFDNLPDLIEMRNKYMVFAYWQYCDGFSLYNALTPEVKIKATDPETIRRARQLLAQEDPKYKSKNDEFNEEKDKKQSAIEEYVSK